MRQVKVIKNPKDFLVEDYSPGLTIDFRHPTCIDRDERFSRLFHGEGISEASTDLEIESAVGASLFKLELAADAADFKRSLNEFVGPHDLGRQLQDVLNRIGVKDISYGRLDKIKRLLESIGCLQRSSHYPVRLYCHIPGETTYLEGGSTHFGYVLDGNVVVAQDDREVPVREGMYFSVGDAAEIRGTGRCQVVTRFDYSAMSHFGGKVEPWGRLNYIDGCTDTILVYPERKGGPCYNALYFPGYTEQTQHMHPSLRCGLVISGEGICKTPGGDYALAKGKVFFLPPETYHSFHTSVNTTEQKSALSIVAFHPDSDFGPTDQDHPMVNRTYFKFIHRLVSSEKTKNQHHEPVGVIADIADIAVSLN